MHQALATLPVDETDLQTFVREQNLAAHIEAACLLFAEFFVTEGPVIMSKKEDPEFPDEWAELHIQAHGTIESVLDSYDRFTKRVVSSFPADASRMIRLSLGMADV